MFNGKILETFLLMTGAKVKMIWSWLLHNVLLEMVANAKRPIKEEGGTRRKLQEGKKEEKRERLENK